MAIHIFRIFGLLSLLFVVAACAPQETPTPELPTLVSIVIPTSTETPTATPTVEISATPTETLTPSSTPTATNTHTPTVTPTHTPNLESTEYVQTQEAILTQQAQNAALQSTLVALGAIPSETPTPVPVENFSPTIYYVIDPARARECARIDNQACPTLTEYPEGAAVMVTGRTVGDMFRDSTEWYRVDANGRIGFIHSSLMSVTPPTPTLQPLDLTLTAVSGTQQFVITPVPVIGGTLQVSGTITPMFTATP